MPQYPSPTIVKDPGYPTGAGPGSNALETPNSNSSLPPGTGGMVIDSSGGSSSSDGDAYITTQQTGNEYGGSPPAAGEPGYDEVAAKQNENKGAGAALADEHNQNVENSIANVNSAHLAQQFLENLKEVVLLPDEVVGGLKPDLKGNNEHYPYEVYDEISSALIAEGLSTKRPEIIALNEFKPLFTSNIENGLSNSNLRKFSPNMLKSISNIENLAPTPATRIIEMQTAVREMCNSNVKNIFFEIAKGLSSDLNNPLNLFEAMEILQEESKSKNLFGNVEYDFVNDTFDIDSVFETIRRKNIPKLEVILSNKDNPYLICFIRYMILENFAQSFMKVIANKAKTKDEHISDFYNDVIVKTKHQKNTKIKQALKTRNMTIESIEDGNYLRKIVRTDLPNSVNIIRLIKSAHAAGSGFMTTSSSEVYNDENNEESNIKLVTQSIEFVKNNANLHYDYYLIFFDPTSEFLPGFDEDEVDSDVSDFITTRMSQMTTNNSSIIKNALYPLLFELKNINNMSTKSAHINLIVSHLHGKSENGTIEDFRNPEIIEYADASLDFNPVGVAVYFDESITSNLSIDKLNNGQVKIKDVLYKNIELNAGEKLERNLDVDKTVNREVYLFDSNGIVHPTSPNDGLFAKNCLYQISDTNSVRLSDTASSLKDSIDSIISDFESNYGLIGYNSETAIPENYIKGYFDSLADILEELDKPATSGTVSKSRLLETILYARSGENKNFSARLFLASIGKFSHGQGVTTSDNDSETGSAVDNVSYTSTHFTNQELTTLNKVQNFLLKAGIQTGAAVSISGGALIALGIPAIATAAAFGGGAGALMAPLIFTGVGIIAVGIISAVLAVLAFRKKNSLVAVPCAMDRLFALYYRDIMPGTDFDFDSYSYLTVDALYDEQLEIYKREYDSGHIEKFWNKNKDNRSLKTVGNDDLADGSQPSAATDNFLLAKAEDFNVVFGNIFKTSASANNSKLVTLPMRYDKGFIENNGMGDLFIETVGGDSIISSGASISGTGCARALLLHNLNAYIIKHALSFTLSLQKLDGNDTNNNNRARQIKVHYNRMGIKGLVQGLRGQEIDSEHENNNNYASAYNVSKNLRDSILEDIKIIHERMLSSLGAIDKLSSYYDSQLQKFISRNLSNDNMTQNAIQFINSNDANNNIDMTKFYTSNQFRLSMALNQKLMRNSQKNYFLPSSKDITKERILSMLKYFSNTDRSFVSSAPLHNLASDKKMIMHVGIPTSMLDNLRNSVINSLGINSLDFEDKSKGSTRIKGRTIVAVNIYRRNLLNHQQNDVLVMTKKFDMAKFMLGNINHNVVVDRHNKFLENNVKNDNFVNAHSIYHISDDLNISEIQGNTLTSVSEDATSENELSAADKKEIFINHLDDYYLKLYCQLMLGLDVDEDVYQFSHAVNQTLENGVDNKLSLTFDEIFVAPLDFALPTSNEQILLRKERNRLLAEASRSVFFSPKKYLNRTVKPKLFDRVFSILLPKPNNEPIEISQYTCSVELIDKEFSSSTSLTKSTLGKNKKISTQTVKQVTQAIKRSLK